MVAATQAGATPPAPPSHADQIAEIIAKAAPTGALTPVAAKADRTFGTAISGHEVSLPSTGDGKIVAGIGKSALTLTLPGKASAKGQVAADGTVVYPASSGGVTTAIQAQADGVRVQTISNGAGDPSSFKYAVGGATPILRADGGVDLVSRAQGPTQLTKIVGGIATPWAVDANGASVGTHYTVEGDSLIQVLDVNASTVYPVVADPKFSLGVGLYVSLNTIEVRTFATAAGIVATMGMGYACTVYGAKIIALIPNMAGSIGYICGSFTGVQLAVLLMSMPSQSTAYYTHTCYQARIPAQSPAWKIVGTSQCVSLADSFKNQ